MKHSSDSGGQISASADSAYPEGSLNPTDSNPRDDNPRELPARRGFSISYRGKTLLSRIDPVAQAERLALEIPLKERTLYLCPSPLYGYGLPLFLERLRGDSQSKNSAILCVEADQKLFEISQKALGELSTSTPGEYAPSGNLRPLAMVRAADPESICAFVSKTWGQRRFRRVETIRLGGGWQLFPRLYEEAADALRREMAVEWGNAMTLIRLGRLYTRNLIRNLALFSEGENISALNFGCTPVLVLGAGPSLDSILNELSSLSGGNISRPDQRRFKIISVDTCLPALHERGILPDLAVILESQHWNLRDFSGARGREIDMAIDLSALPASGRVLGGKRYFFTTPWTELSLFKRLEQAGLLPETFAPLGSVGLSAVALALRISCGPVLTGGIDFSYTLDAYHARSTPGYGDMERRQNRTRSIVNAGAAFREGSFSALSKTGGAVRSDPAMRRYRSLFRLEFGGNPRLLDIAGSGLSLGVKTVSPAEAFAVLNRGGESSPAAINSTGNNTSADDQGADNPAADRRREKIAAFIRGEINTLTVLLKMLSGEIPADDARLEELLEAADYLWAHFPECAAAGGRRPPSADTSFLKRVRTEIEPFLKCWEMAYK